MYEQVNTVFTNSDQTNREFSTFPSRCRPVHCGWVSIMSDPLPTRFFPIPLLAAGITLWIVLTVRACVIEISTYDLTPEASIISIVIIGLGIIAFLIAFVVGWTTLLIALAINWFVPSRRVVFRRQLREYFYWFYGMAVLAFLVILFILMTESATD